MSVQTQPKKSNAKYIGIGIIVIVLIILFVPFIPVKYTELTTSTVTTTTTLTQTYTETAPMQVEVSRSQDLWSLSDYTLDPNHYVYGSSYIPSGRNVIFAVKASDTVDAYIFTSTDFQNYKSNSANSMPIVQRKDSANIQMSFQTTADDTYYFVVYNRHTGFLGIGSKTVGIYSATSTSSWKELTTTYTPQVKYKEVVTPTQTSIVTPVEKTKYVSLFQQLTGTG